MLQKSIIFRTRSLLGKPSKQFLLCSYLTVYAIAILAGFVAVLDLPNLFSNYRNGIAALFLFDRFGVELLLVLLIVLLFYRNNAVFRITVHISSGVMLFVQGFQLAAFYQTRDFISKLAIENINHISLIINSQSISFVLILVSLVFFPVVVLEKFSTTTVIRHPFYTTLMALLLGITILLSTSSKWLPKGIWQIRETYFIKNYMLHTSPLLALYNTLTTKPGDATSEFTAFEIQELKRSGFFLNSGDEYPLVKDTVYHGKMPFAPGKNVVEKPNIIVFFSEGISERSLSISDDVLYPDLTPNIEDFAKHSMVVKNYYSHTAATYRGLLGQLCSLFPKYGGAVDEARYLSLADIFNKLEYDTLFFDSHDKDKAHVDELMARIGFKEVFTAAPLLQRYLNGEASKGFEALSETQFFSAFVGFLKERAQLEKMQTPFFLCLYNLGTHAFRDITVDGKKYQRKDNLSLHTIHNYDHAFGTFWRYYQSSPYRDNTIVIFTSDHSHIAERPFVQAFKQPGYQGLFVDKIPLIIHDPIRNLPEEFDAVHSTSIDFAPSLMHYLELPNLANPFLGTSIFMPRNSRSVRYGYAQHGKAAFLVDEHRVHRLRYTKQYKEKLSLVNKFIKYTQELEVTGKLWHD